MQTHSPFKYLTSAVWQHRQQGLANFIGSHGQSSDKSQQFLKGRSALQTNDTAAFSWGVALQGRNDGRVPNFRIWSYLAAVWLDDGQRHWTRELAAWLQPINSACVPYQTHPLTPWGWRIQQEWEMQENQDFFCPFLSFFLGEGRVEIKSFHFVQISQLCWNFQSPALWCVISWVLLRR